ncbi:Radical SAM domain protein [Ruminiclostridium papyrosolvens DSM 2782]|uniref:Radical SAM domain protein n=1 Tax=Ruminiclostridium papyrosolvens DSM 2782 TaxID=588581 RepID=F1TF90_9FIRM|nr:radical SAM protein [Ruminiclostridium papyrosolvens]EGD47028.1 Radical SAM domain protein [Ruminiclostridium papyrosolvens DSM 2782]WES33722.1 radical SAM protein [Ruminiclostridium papyrosolvens DSM 2782]
MSNFKKIINEDEIYRIVSEANNTEAGQYFAKFLKKKGFKLTYDSAKKQYFINSFLPAIPSKAWDKAMDTLDSIKKGERKLFQSDVVVTGRCHCNCWHCYRNKSSRYDLSLESVKSFIEQTYELGVANIGITGGEPMLRNDIKDIISFIPEGMQAQLYTTGHKIDDEFCKFLSNSNVSRVIISLDHYKEEVVVKTRDSKNAFQESLEAIKVLQANNIYTVVTICIIDSFTTDEIEEYFKFVSELGIQEIRIVLPIPQGKIEGMDCKMNYKVAKRMIMDIKEKYINNPDYPNVVLFSEFESAKCMGCSAGIYYLTLNNDGAYTPCVAVPLSFGDITQDTVKDVLEDMSQFFKCAGRTCYGRKIGRIIQDMGIDTGKIPLDTQLSKTVAEKYIVEGLPPEFYDGFFNNLF